MGSKKKIKEIAEISLDEIMKMTKRRTMMMMRKMITHTLVFQ